MIKKVTILLALVTVFTAHALAASSLEREIKNDLKQFDGRVGVFAQNLNTGRTIEFNQDEIFPTASTSKLVVALATYKYLYPQAGSAKASQYDQQIELMMTVSDNNAFQELLNEMDTNNQDVLTKTVKDLKLRKTQIHNKDAFQKYQYHSVTTPYEMGKVFEKIYTGKYLNKSKNGQLKDELANTIYNDEIPRYMQTPVFHKVGELDEILCDVGVIQDGHDPILISFFTTTADHTYSSNFIASESAKIYNALRRK
ncbi:serine hydrolase [Pelosinus baikalensis]|uniref:Metallo-hydrolase family protein n=1 Tax=Pelosinus baikalensis TaxID=2892015 RepID=A0ABS8HT55_9FIRM|nr:metallo-hydrolase family protein [Pelosinus baikalensis]MCC5465791.1 metallo-hydrolase family protein [Pelosinus baikalensis]